MDNVKLLDTILKFLQTLSSDGEKKLKKLAVIAIAYLILTSILNKQLQSLLQYSTINHWIEEYFSFKIRVKCRFFLI